MITISPIPRSGQIVVHHPTDAGKVRQFTGSGAPQWVDLATATFAECAVTLEQIGTTGIYYATLDVPDDATYPILLYGTDATGFSDQVIGTMAWVPEPTVPPTVEEIRTEIDNNSTISARVEDIHDKLPTSNYLAGSDSEDGAVATDASLTITPYQVNTSNPRYSTRDLPPIAQGSEPTEVWTITNSEGAAVDLSGKTIRVVVCAVDKGELDANSQPFDDTLTGSFKYETGDGITIRGDDNNQVWLDHDASKTATPGVYRYFLWNVTDKLLLAKGRMPIEPAKMDLA